MKSLQVLWHHKSDRDDFFSDTGISWTVDTERVNEIKVKTSQETIKKSSKQLTDDDLRLINAMREEGKGFPEIIEYMRKKDKEHGIEVDRFNATDPKKNLSNKLNRWNTKNNLK